jgi:hypothetical protein
MAVGGATVGALKVVLGADTAQFEDGIRKAQSLLGTFSDKINLKVTAAVTSAAAAIGGIGYTIANAFSEASDMLDAGEKLGIYVDELSKIKFVADQVGASFQDLAQNLQSAMGDAQGMGGRTLAALGIDPQLFTSVEATMKAVADRFAVMQDGADKTKLAVNLFGSEAEKLLPILDRGSAGIDKLTQRAEQLGYVMDERTAEAGRRLKNALAELTGVSDNWGGIILKRLPVIVEMTEKIADMWKGVGEAKNQFSLFTAGLELAIAAGKSITSVFIGLAAQVGNLVAMLVNGNAAIGRFLTFDFSGAKATLEAGIEDVRARNQMMWDDINKIWAEGWNQVEAKTREGAENFKTEMAPVVEEMEQAKDKAKALLMELLASPWEDFATKMAAVKQALADGVITPVEEVRMRMRLLTDEWRLQREEARAALDSLTSDAWTSAADKLDAVAAAARRGTISFREMGQMSRQIADQQRQQWMDLGSTLSTFLTTAFDKSKAAAIAAAIINTAQGITRALAQGGIFGWAQAALIAATGAVQIAKIRSTSSSSGGSAPSVGSGGASAGADAGGSAAGGGVDTVFVRGIDPSAIFTGDAVSSLIELLMEKQRDGAQVILRPT